MWVNDRYTAEELDAYLRPFWEQWLRSLPKEQRDALASYKSMGYLLFAIAQDADRSFTPDDLACFAALDAAFAQVSWPRDTLLWRGFRAWGYPDGAPPRWSPPSPGEVQTFPGWTSTSLVETAAAAEAHFQLAQSGEWSVLFELALPAGHPAIYIEPVKTPSTHEAEVLLPRGTRFEVRGFEPFDRLRTSDRGAPFHGFRLRAQVLPYQAPPSIT